MENLKERIETLIEELKEERFPADYEAGAELIENIASGGNHDDTFESGWGYGHTEGQIEALSFVLKQL